MFEKIVNLVQMWYYLDLMPLLIAFMKDNGILSFCYQSEDKLWESVPRLCDYRNKLKIKTPTKKNLKNVLIQN